MFKIPLKANNVPTEPGWYIGGSNEGQSMTEIVRMGRGLFLKIDAYNLHPLEKCNLDTRWSDKLEFVSADETEGEILRRNLLQPKTALEDVRGLLHLRINLDAVTEAAKQQGLGKLAHAAHRAAAVITEYKGRPATDWPEIPELRHVPERDV